MHLRNFIVRDFFNHLCSYSRELECLKGLIINGGAWIDVDHHAGDSSAAEEALQDPGQFAVPERNHLRGPGPGNAF